MNGENFRRKASLSLVFFIFLVAVGAQAQNPVKNKGTKSERTSGPDHEQKNSKVALRLSEKWAAKQKISPKSALTQPELAEWLGHRARIGTSRSFSKKVPNKTGLSTETRNKLKALKKEALAARRKKRPVHANARIGGTTALYVNKLAEGTNDGSSWENAYKELADALQDAANNPVGEIWVAWGTYKPLYLADDVNSTSSTNRNNAFVLVPGVKIYGGFIGGELSLEERDLTGTDSYGLLMEAEGFETATILSGDFEGDDGECSCSELFVDTDENAYHVVVSVGDVEGAVLDGVIIAGGNADVTGQLEIHGVDVDQNFGGGIALYDSSPMITNVVIRNNQAVSGAAIYASSSHSILTNALVVTNQSHEGGVFLNNSDLVITNATIAGNTGDGVAAANGAGIYLAGELSTPQIRNTIIYGNTVDLKPNVSVNSDAVPSFSYSIVEGSGGSGITEWDDAFGDDGGNNLDADPKFYDAEYGDFSIKPRSPAVNAGDNTLFDAGGIPDLSGIATDVRGTARNMVGAVDMGAIESLYDNGSVILFVDKRAGGNNDGSSWLDAYTELADALQDAANNPVQQIWVARGTYKPRYLADNVNSAWSTDRDNAFVLVPNVKIYGGFYGVEETLEERDLTGTDSYDLIMQEEGFEMATILSGDFEGDDGTGAGGEIFSNTEENAHHVVISAGEVGNAELNGVIVTGGNTDGGSSPVINTITINGDAGGGIGLYNSSPIITNVVIRNNQALFGGGLYARGSGSSLTNALVVTNQSNQGGIHLEGSPITITNATIAGNMGYGSDANGGGIYVTGAASNAGIRNTIIYGNTADSNPNVSVNSSAAPSISYSIVEGSRPTWSTTFGIDGGNNLDADPRFFDAGMGAFGLKPGSPAINAGNSSLFNAGGIPDLSSITTDVRGSQRNNANGGVDIGAIESFYKVLFTDLTPTAGRLYVKKGGGAIPKNGSSWANAAPEVADALFAAALNPAITEIWVAGGAYHPLYRPDNLSKDNPTDKYNAFSLVSGVKIYGGFAGSETTLTQRNLSKKQNASILSADFNDDDPVSAVDLLLTEDEFPETMAENAFHVVYAVGTTGAVLDGFTVEGSNILGPLLEGEEDDIADKRSPDTDCYWIRYHALWPRPDNGQSHCQQQSWIDQCSDTHRI